MYSSLVNWIGSKTCNLAGDLSEVLSSSSACANGQSTNMGLVVLALIGLAVVVMVINARRRNRRENDSL